MAKKKRPTTDRDANSPDSKLDFEAALEEVQAVVEKLESGELGLSESLAQYERGIEKIKRCHEALEQAEKRISILTEVAADGAATVEPVDYRVGSDRGGSDRGGSDNGEGVESETTPEKPPTKRARRRRSPSPDADIDDQDGLF